MNLFPVNFADCKDIDLRTIQAEVVESREQYGMDCRADQALRSKPKIIRIE